ncbi:DHA1 family purine ribonucleoside efflux pump-like MFS transporter/DHA1 family bicyclomycin/chloramphenicol resistance-like MFS transporter [Neorhizobium alkalisoli]|uniref:Bcr/CflA family efflux transporter n=2 Tax=Neorhizobium alkalisoli TaxID=528178 RepID=A0A561QIP3_9HYPH|nr:DHA1 family purine ribonucleoside efflux pump-like MFS transporter/DHA1 family bicyclomycin/chloramphenicol resistance-like MFS transporter [Neorhizobium alkalisoli]
MTADNVTAQAPATMSERRTATLGAMLTAIGPVSMAIYTPAMPELVRAFGTTEAAIKLSLSLYFGGFALAQLAAGPISDAFGRRFASISFLLIYVAGSLMATFAPSVEWILAGRLIQGIGASVGMTVARAAVRDQFVGAEAARIMNLIGIILAIGPAMGPSLGGLSLSVFGWKSIFVLMVLIGLVLLASCFVFLKETTIPDRSRLKPLTLISTYATLITDLRFLLPSMVLGGAIGALYAQGTMLPFVMIGVVGLTPTQFGLGMLIQTGAYLGGSIALRLVSKRLSGPATVMIGLTFSGIGGTMMLLSVLLLPPSFLSIMLPVGVSTFGIAFITPYTVTAGLAPFPKIAGSASALMGFIQMGGGFVGGLIASAFAAPLTSIGTIIPAMEYLAVGSYVAYRIINKRQ